MILGRTQPPQAILLVHLLRGDRALVILWMSVHEGTVLNSDLSDQGPFSCTTSNGWFVYPSMSWAWSSKQQSSDFFNFSSSQTWSLSELLASKNPFQEPISTDHVSWCISRVSTGCFKWYADHCRFYRIHRIPPCLTWTWNLPVFFTARGDFFLRRHLLRNTASSQGPLRCFSIAQLWRWSLW